MAEEQINRGETDSTPKSVKELFGGLAVSSDKKMGLALSGGGFRAALFHLGVIRRLEELGLMKQISAISAVSGGSIIAAFYVIEMDRLLREKLYQLEEGTKTLDEIRLENFEQIAENFIAAISRNMRCRAMVFAPFYHPLRWLRSLWPGYSRSDTIAVEYDKWLYDNNSLDQLPSVTERNWNNQNIVFGPKLILNATSLLDGSRVEFSRIPVSRFMEFGKVNRNVLKLSRVVAASSCVPGVFVPVQIAGDKLVDGGVSDNQGLEALIREYDNDQTSRTVKRTGPGQAQSSGERYPQFDMLFVSDASGQMELVHKIKDKEVAVLSRVMSILQFHVREKLIDLLVAWKFRWPRPGMKLRDEKQNISSRSDDFEIPNRNVESDNQAKKGTDREFAFTHLFLNLKDRPQEVDRVPSEYIAGLGRLRTDLDEFSSIECESLMYHGYTQIDAQIKKHCPRLCDTIKDHDRYDKLSCGPLFSAEQSEYKPATTSQHSSRRKRIKKELVSGQHKSVILRTAIKAPGKVVPIVVMTWLLPTVLLYLYGIRPYLDWLDSHVGRPVLDYLKKIVPDWVNTLFSEKLGFFQWPITSRGAATIVTLAVAIYLLLFATYLIVRCVAKRLDASDYANLTSGSKFSTKWQIKL